jgi:hypothetical protein
MIEVFETDSEMHLACASSFVKMSLGIPSVMILFVGGERLTVLWKACFVGNPRTSRHFGAIVIEAIRAAPVKYFEKFRGVLPALSESFAAGAISAETAQMAIDFVAEVVRKGNSGDFFSHFFPAAMDLFPFLTSFGCFSSFLVSATSDPGSPWTALNSICNRPISAALLESAIDAVCTACESPQLHNFSFWPFVARARELSSAAQARLFSILERFPPSVQFEFFSRAAPPWVSGVDSAVLVGFVRARDWNSRVAGMLSKIVTADGFSEAFLADPAVAEIVDVLVGRLPQNGSVAALLLLPLIRITNGHSSEVAIRCIERLVQQDDTPSIVDTVIIALDQRVVSDSVFIVLARVARCSPLFVQGFLERQGTMPLFAALRSEASLSFLGALAANGPIHEIDEFITAHFKETALAELPDETLGWLMMGAPSAGNGVLRIPSLLSFVSSVKLETPMDRYVFGRYALPDCGKLHDYTPRFMDLDLAGALVRDPKLLVNLTDPTLHHFPIFQCHKDVPHCAARSRFGTTTTFWLFLEEIHDETVLLTTDFGQVRLGPTWVTFFGGPPIGFEQKKWQMITIVIAVGTFSQCDVTVFVDTVKKFYIVRQKEPSYDVTFGSTTETNGIYYLSGSIQTSDLVLSPQDIRYQYLNGPGFFAPTPMRMLPGFVYVPYRGIAKYLDGFGGQEFIFLELLKCESRESFALLLTSAFNLLKLNLLDESFFFSALRYVFFAKPGFFDQNLICDQIASFATKRLSYVLRFFCDYHILCLSDVSGLIKSEPESLQLFHFICDTYMIFDLPPTIAEASLRSISCFVEANPPLLKTLLLRIAAIPFLAEDAVADLVEPARLPLQVGLLRVVTDNLHLLPAHVSFEDVLLALSTLPDTLAVDLLELVAKISTIRKGYVNVDVLKKSQGLLTMFAPYRKLWSSLFIWYTGRVGDEIQEFAELGIAEPGLTEQILDLLPYLIAHELPKPSLSLQVLTVVVTLMSQANMVLLDYVSGFQRLCALGLDQRPPSPIPFPLDPDAAYPKRAVKQPEMYEFKVTRVHTLNAALFQETVQYLQRMPAPVGPPREASGDSAVLEALGEVMESDLVRLIANFTAALFVQSQGDAFTKKTMVALLINGADVVPAVAVGMHRKIALAILASAHRLSDESIDVFIRFEINRLIEGWWENRIVALFDAAIPRGGKAMKELQVACLMSARSVEMQLDVLERALAQPLFAEWLKDAAFLGSVTHIFSRDDIFADSRWPSLQRCFFSVLQEDIAAHDIAELDHSLAASRRGSLISDDLMKASVAAWKGTRDRRFDVTRPERLVGRERTIRVFDALEIRRAVRFQFFHRYNSSMQEIETAIGRLFRKQKILEFAATPVDKWQLARSPSPLCVSQKLIPLCYAYVIPLEKTAPHVPVPMSTHTSPFQTRIGEITRTFVASRCFEGWQLPGFAPVGLRGLLASVWGAISPLFELRILVSSEVLPCVGGYTPECFCILLNAKLSRDELVVNEAVPLFCFFTLFENAFSGAYGKSGIFCHNPFFQIPFSEIVIALPRRYVYRDVAADIFTVLGLHLTLIFTDPDRKAFMQRVPKPPQNEALSGPFFASSILSLPRERVTAMWVNREISTYTYLLYLNTVGSRSFNDLAQYPVFPWVLGGFTGDRPMASRDLTKPMGAQTPDRAERFQISYQEAKIHYGTHYSQPAIVLHFMLRLEPFTAYNIDLHNGLDHRDRQFTSMTESWRSASESNQSDVKELLPEFCTIPYMFENANHFEFGQRTDGTSLDTVVLPPWAKNPVDFVWKMRAALEDSESVHSWIDLIFGYKQRGPAAVEALNVFQSLCYDDVLQTGEGVGAGEMDAINQFGQCPPQLFLAPHPQRAIAGPATLATRGTRVAQLRGFIPHCATIRMRGDVPFFCSKFEHFIGPDFTSIRVWDNYIESGSRVFPSIDACCSSALSSDGNLLVICSRLGIATVLCCATTIPREIFRFPLPSSDIRTVAISAHFGLICGAGPDSILLFDLCSGFLARRIAYRGAVLSIEFDEANGFIAVAGQDGVALFALDLRTVASLKCRQSPITATSCQPANVWFASPIMATGHADGNARIWQLDTQTWVFRETACFSGLRQPLAAVHLFASGQALLMIDVDGCSCVASMETIGAKFIHVEIFENCAACGGALRGNGLLRGKGALCSQCGLAVCKKCITAKRPVCCSRCIQAEGEASSATTEEEDVEEQAPLPEITPRPSSGYSRITGFASGSIDLLYREDGLRSQSDLPFPRKSHARSTL